MITVNDSVNFKLNDDNEVPRGHKLYDKKSLLEKQWLL